MALNFITLVGALLLGVPALVIGAVEIIRINRRAPRQGSLPLRVKGQSA